MIQSPFSSESLIDTKTQFSGSTRRDVIGNLKSRFYRRHVDSQIIAALVLEIFWQLKKTEIF